MTPIERNYGGTTDIHTKTASSERMTHEASNPLDDIPGPLDGVKAFISANRWRLHDLFSRVKGRKEDYRLPVDEVFDWIQIVGGLKRPSKGFKPCHFMVSSTLSEQKLLLGLLKSPEFEGSLATVLPTHLKRFLSNAGMDMRGRIDYRVVLDDHAVGILPFSTLFLKQTRVFWNFIIV